MLGSSVLESGCPTTATRNNSPAIDIIEFFEKRSPRIIEEIAPFVPEGALDHGHSGLDLNEMSRDLECSEKAPGRTSRSGTRSPQAVANGAGEDSREATVWLWLLPRRGYQKAVELQRHQVRLDHRNRHRVCHCRKTRCAPKPDLPGAGANRLRITNVAFSDTP